MKSTFLRGSFILTSGMILTKIFGLLYIIPFTAIVGNKGIELYAYGYVPYTIFISIATGGLPLAVSKFVAKYNTLGQYNVGYKLFKSGIVLMIFTGLLSFIILFLIAPKLSVIVLPDQGSNFLRSDVTLVIRSVSFALILVPVMSLIRGFFQGYGSMGPTAISQVVEQLFRVLFLLLGAYLVLNLLGGTIVTAISIATFSAFIGAIASLLILIWYWIRRRKNILNQLNDIKEKVSLKHIYMEVITYSIPFVFAGLAFPIHQLIDQLTFNKTLESIGLAEQSGYLYSILSMTAPKLVLIPITLASAFTQSIVPNVTEIYMQNNFKAFKISLNKIIQIFLFLIIPASIGISILSSPIYTAFFGFDKQGQEILSIYSPVAIVIGLFSITAAILQGINKQKVTIIGLLLAISIKILINTPLIELYQAKGAILATAISFLISIIINLIGIQFYSGFRYRFLFRRCLLIIIFTIVMGLLVLSFDFLLSFFINEKSRLGSILLLLITIPLGIFIYFYLSIRSKLFVSLFGQKIELLIKNYI
ncbi:putative polysaccharide biosynthesis protein [Bacillus andreraoultii]|uniref:putative polysaccharide biosynthesis protein n=1 Tax=Bacillus andreraoultii TaxID=1499685 RepID=UPI0005399F5D|nr:polysaccharide biosynthesis protein [Bacillus andreraoultii]